MSRGQHPCQGLDPSLLTGLLTSLLPARSLLIWVSESEGGKRCEETKVQEGDRRHEAPGYVILMSTEKRECGKDLVDCFEIAVTFT